MAIASPVTTTGAVAFITPDSGGQAATPTMLFGFIVSEQAGAAASFRIRDGDSGGAVLVPKITLASGGVSSPSFSEGIEITTGKLYFEALSGSVAGSIFWG